MTRQWYTMSSRNNIFCVTISLIISFLTLSPAVSIYAQSISSEVAQWFVPLDLGKQLKIKCNGSLVDFVIRLYFTRQLQIIKTGRKRYTRMYSRFKIQEYLWASDFSITNTRKRLTINSKTCSLNDIVVLRHISIAVTIKGKYKNKKNRIFPRLLHHLAGARNIRAYLDN